MYVERVEEVVEVGIITTFKRYLSGYVYRKGWETYGPDAGKWDYLG